jgi:hypothetical protein
MTRLLFVHGIAQEGRSSDELKVEWLKSLNVGLQAGDFAPISSAIVPFFGDELARWSHQSSVASGRPDPNAKSIHPDLRSRRATPPSHAIPDNLTHESPSQNADFSKFALEYAADAVTENPAAAAQAIAMGLASRQLKPDDQKRDLQNWPPLIELTRILDGALPDISGFFIARFLNTVHCYLTDDRAFDAVNSIVLKSLKESDEPTVVVGHSLGSVVAYHVLHSQTEVQVPLFATVGSPLAISAVERRLKVRPGQPTCVNRWYNAFDRKDIVALNPLDENHFKVSRKIENNAKVCNDTDNHHSISGYLSDRNIATKISEASQ